MNYFAKHKVSRLTFTTKCKLNAITSLVQVHLWCRADLTNELMQADALISVWFLQSCAHKPLELIGEQRIRKFHINVFFIFFHFHDVAEMAIIHKTTGHESKKV
jgi:hypothetical protein